MPIDETAPRSRRAMLAASLGGLTALVAGALGRPSPVAAEGQTVVVGGEYTDATSQTKIHNDVNTSVVLWGDSRIGVGIRGKSISSTGVDGSSTTGIGVSGLSSTNLGISGRSTSHIGIHGESDSYIGVHGASVDHVAVYGETDASTAVLGFSGTGGGPAIPIKTGVYGYAVQDSASRGVTGETTLGQGVRGVATGGIGVRGIVTGGIAGAFLATDGLAIKAEGRLSFDRASGTATIGSGTRTVTVTPGVDVGTGTFVIATLQGDPGGTTAVQRVSVDATNDRFTIYLTANATSAVKVAWLALG